MHLVDDGVYRSKHVVGAFLSTQHKAVTTYGKLRHLPILTTPGLLDREFNTRLLDVGKVAIELIHLFFHIFTQPIGDLHILSLQYDLHHSSPFSRSAIGRV